jgi:opacity protein-like surface antigen
MRKLLLLLGLELFITLPLQAQGAYPRAEIFGGYSYLHTDLLFESNIPKGWNASVTGNPHRMIGIEADFSGHYGSQQARFAPELRHDYRTHLFMFGPRFAARLPKVTPWAHALFGASHLSVRGRDFAGEYSDSRTAFTWALGGGLDINAHKNLALRVIQADYIRANSRTDVIGSRTGPYFSIGSGPSNNFRLSFGVVVKWDKG